MSFDKRLSCVVNKANKLIAFLRKLQTFLSRKSIVTIYKSFIRPYLDNGDVINDQPFNKWVKVFKNGPSKICGRQPLENLKWYDLYRQTISLHIF